VQLILLLLAGAVVLDLLARPRPTHSRLLRSMAGAWLLLLLAGALFGAWQAIIGNALASLALSLAVISLFTMVSNAKHIMLGEPLLFTDLALLKGVFRHPQFYFSALSTAQKGALALAVPAVPGLVYWLFRCDAEAHLAGLATLAGSLALLKVSFSLLPWAGLVVTPEPQTDVERHGLLASMLLYWIKWRGSEPPAPVAPITSRPSPGELAVLVQCESFADPAELFGDPSLMLPGLAAARSQAWQWGNLMVSGFGAYTMRTEYGVLFGRGEVELGFRRFDPFLTATAEASFALPNRLAEGGWRSLFVHPHDMRFYNRAEIMTAAGFAELVGEERFAPPGPGDGRYVSDAAMAEGIMDLACEAQGPTLIYSVTIENHGPWETTTPGGDLALGYLHMVRKGDAMLATLMAGLAKLERPVTLVFFGDHRPSIPSISMPGGDRHTPYVIIRIDERGQAVPGLNRRVDITPAQLHHCLLDLWAA